MRSFRYRAPFIFALIAGFLICVASTGAQPAAFMKKAEQLAKKAGYQFQKIDDDVAEITATSITGEKVLLRLVYAEAEATNIQYINFAVTSGIRLSNYSEDIKNVLIEILATSSVNLSIGSWAYLPDRQLVILLQKYFLGQFKTMDAAQFKKICYTMASIVSVIDENEDELIRNIKKMKEVSLGIAASKSADPLMEKIKTLLKPYSLENQSLKVIHSSK